MLENQIYISLEGYIFLLRSLIEKFRDDEKFMSADQQKVWYSELIELAQPYEKVVLEEKCVFKEDNFFFFRW